MSCLAQQPGPATLEGLLNSDEAQKPAAAAEADAAPNRPAGTVARPKDGVKHPDLEKAWADYDAAVTKAAEGIQASINKQFDAATAKGDLDEAEKWQIALEKFEKAGEVPTEKEAKMAVSAAVADYKKAREELSKAYETVVKSLTIDKKIAEAKAVRGELVGFTSQKPLAAAQVEKPNGKAGEAKRENLDPLLVIHGPTYDSMEWKKMSFEKAYLKENDGKPFEPVDRTPTFAVAKTAFGEKDVIFFHPVDGKTPGRLVFDRVTSQSRGRLLVKVRNQPTGSSTVSIVVQGRTVFRERLAGGVWRSIAVPFDHEAVEATVTADDWWCEGCMLTYRLAK